MIKITVILCFLLVIASLGAALYNLIVKKPEEHSKNTVKALTIRISLSLLLFIFVFIAISSGLITPHGIGTNFGQKRPASALTNDSK